MANLSRDTRTALGYLQLTKGHRHGFAALFVPGMLRNCFLPSCRKKSTNIASILKAVFTLVHSLKPENLNRGTLEVLFCY